MMSILTNMLALLAGDGVLTETDSSKRDARMPLTLLEQQQLFKLKGRAKKQYIKQLRRTYENIRKD